MLSFSHPQLQDRGSIYLSVNVFYWEEKMGVERQRREKGLEILNREVS